jgi:hypothetical protein
MGHPNISNHTHYFVILTNGKDLLFACASEIANWSEKQVLRYAQG